MTSASLITLSALQRLNTASDNPKLYGVPENFEFTIRDFVINTGAEMIVAIAGEIMRMPGLPKEPQAKVIDIIDGQIVGLS